jgi:C4-dicarboxylate transporter DctQ subunit
VLTAADRWLTVFETSFLAIGTAVAVSVATVQVILRYLGGTGLFWAEELTVYIIVWTAFLSAGAAVRTGEHLTVEILQVTLGPRFAAMMTRIVGVVGALSAAALTVYGIQFVLVAYEYGQLSSALQIPMWIVYLVVPLSGMLLVIRFIEQIAGFNSQAVMSVEETPWP